MKNLLCLSVFLLSSVVAIGQTKNSMLTEYEVFQQQILSKKQNKQHTFILAENKQIDENALSMKMGIGGFYESFKVVVTPVKYEKNTEGKLVKIAEFSPTSVSMKGNKKDEPQFANPEIVLEFNNEMNAFEIAVNFDNSENNQMLTVKLGQKGKIISTN
jgi:hypothetical protein